MDLLDKELEIREIIWESNLNNPIKNDNPYINIKTNNIGSNIKLL